MSPGPLLFKFFFILVTLVFSQTITAQPWGPQKNFSAYNLLEEEKSFLKQKSTERSTGKIRDKYIHRWFDSNKTNIDKDGRLLKRIGIQELQDAINYKNQANEFDHIWNSVGPYRSPYSIRGVGRVNDIESHPAEPGRFYAAAPSGGLWMSSDTCQSWYTSTDKLAHIGVTEIEINPQNPDHLIVATGDPDGWATWSYGLIKSYDRGLSWEHMILTPDCENIDECISDYSSDFQQVHGLYWHPIDTNIILLATNQAYFRSNDGGINWSKYDGLSIRDLKAHPTNPDIIYAWGNDFDQNIRKIFMYSIDAGLSWTYVTLPDSDATRAVIGVSSLAPSVVYVATADWRSPNDFEALYKSVDEGISFSKVTISNGFSGGQSPYDFAIAVDPEDSNTLYIGIIGIYKSVDGGQNWLSVGGSSHADYHSLDFLHGELYAGNDGGVFRFINNNMWDELNENLAITQYYRISCSETDSTIMLAGSQDNGTHKFDLSWKAVFGSDGMDNGIDPHDPRVMYFSSQNGTFVRSENGGISYSTMLSSFITGTSGAWVTPFSIDPHLSNVLYAGYDRLWKSIDYGNSWVPTSNPIAGAGTLIQDFVVSPSETDIIYVSFGGGIYKSEDAGESWTSVNDPAISTIRIEIDPSDPSHIWIVGSQEIHESHDSGESWEDIKWNLPDGIGLNIVAYDEGTDEHLYLGTDIGVWFKTDTMTTWKPYSNLLPNVPIRDLEIMESFNKLRAATYGRGIWETYTVDYYGCYDSLNVETVVYDGIYHASHHISSDAIQYHNIETDFKAGHSISLNPGFEVQQASVFLAYIETCPEIENINELLLPDGHYCETSILLNDIIGIVTDTFPIASTTTFGQTNWYRLEPMSNYLVDILSCGGDANTTLRIYRGNSCEDLYQLSEITDLCSTTSGNDTEAAGVYGQELSRYSTYYLEWIGEDNAEGFTFEISIPDSTGYFCHTAQSIQANNINNAFPKQNGGTNNTGASWFEYTATLDGTIDIISCNGGGDTFINLWIGTCLNLQLVDSNSGTCALNEEEPGIRAAALYDIDVSAGLTYYLEWNDTDGSEPFTFQLIEDF